MNDVLIHLDARLGIRILGSRSIRLLSRCPCLAHGHMAGLPFLAGRIQAGGGAGGAARGGLGLGGGGLGLGGGGLGLGGGGLGGGLGGGGLGVGLGRGSDGPELALHMN